MEDIGAILGLIEDGPGGRLHMYSYRRYVAPNQRAHMKFKLEIRIIVHMDAFYDGMGIVRGCKDSN